MLGGGFAAAAVLISFGALLGKTNPLQLLFMSIVETTLYLTNSYIGYTLLNAVDAGGNLTIIVIAIMITIVLLLLLKSGKKPNSHQLDLVIALFYRWLHIHSHVWGILWPCNLPHRSQKGLWKRCYTGTSKLKPCFRRFFSPGYIDALDILAQF